MILYEVETTVDPDQYNLWHSLKKDYPDLNLSGYEYDRVDILLEEGRTELSRTVRKEKYDLFQKYLMDDAPAILLYRPTYVYIVPKDIEGPNLEEICYPEDRFRNIAEWIL
jgi:peptide/nickel transport system substrate-binding protein